MFTKENLEKIIKNTKNIQKKMENIQKDISHINITGESGAGLVKIIINGIYQCKKIKISQELWKEKNKNLIIDLIIAAFNDATKKIATQQAEKISIISKNMNL